MPSLVIDLETTGLNPFTVDKTNVIGIKRLEDNEKVYFVRDYLKHESMLNYIKDEFDIRPIGMLEEYINENKRLGKVSYIYHNGKFDSLFTLVDLGIDLPITHDTMILTYLTSTAMELIMNRRKWLDLKSAAQRILDVPEWDVDVSTKTGLNRAMFHYLSKDLDHTGELYKVIYPKLTKEDKITYAIIMKALNVFRDIERNGIPIDLKKLEETHDRYLKDLTQIDNNLKSYYPETNFNSSKQVIEIIYKDLDFPVKKLTKRGAPSVAVGALKELQGKHVVIDLILEKRGKEKALSFLKDWREKHILGRLHPNFNLHTTVTGRTSCNNPNIQQVPRNKDLKGLFTGKLGETELVQIDYSQMELRMAAIVANVKEMKEAYLKNQDIHTEMAKAILKKDDISKEDRTLAKPVNFGFIYGMAAKTFPEYAKTTFGIDISIEQSIELREMFFKKYPELIEWYESVKVELLSDGEVKTLLGRRYSVGFPALLDKNQQIEFIRKAINAKVQTPSSDYALLGLIHLHERIKTMDGIKICATVHDSIILEVKITPDAKDKLTELKKILEKPNHVDNIVKYLEYPEIDIPIVADVEVGPWGSGVDLKDWEEFPF